MSGAVISENLVVHAGVDGLNTDSPIVGYQTLVTTSNVTATTEDPDFPASNLATAATSAKQSWKAGAGSPSSDEYLTVTLDQAEQVDYLAVAAHNFGSTQAAVSIEGNSEDTGSPADWFELVSPHLLSSDAPAIFRFTPEVLVGIRLRVQAALLSVADVPQCAVMYAGRLLYLQRRIYVPHTPLPYGRQLSVASQRSIAGAFLGRIVLSETLRTTIALQNLTAAWYRTYMDPFLVAAKTSPFFFAWRPGTYPSEAGFAWLADDPQVANQAGNGTMQVTLNLEGIAS